MKFYHQTRIRTVVATMKAKHANHDTTTPHHVIKLKNAISTISTCQWFEVGGHASIHRGKILAMLFLILLAAK